MIDKAYFKYKLAYEHLVNLQVNIIVTVSISDRA
jgi:hypothetical protein